MISVWGASARRTSPSERNPWAFAIAVGITFGTFVAILGTAPNVSIWPDARSSNVAEALRERLTYVTPRVVTSAADPRAPAITSSAESPAARPTVARRAARPGEYSPTVPSAAPTVRDSGSTPRTAPLQEASAPPRPRGAAPSLRLDLPSPLLRAFPQPRAPRDPFAAPGPPTAADAGATLDALGFDVPSLARARKPTQSERDEAMKERSQAIRMAGRPLLAPPGAAAGNAAGASIGLPLFSAGPSKATRARNEAAFKSNAVRLARLRDRADSLVRARAESLARSH